MLKTSLIASSTTLKLLKDVVNKDKVDKKRVNGKRGNEKKNLPTLSTLQRPTKVDYLISKAKKTFIFVQNAFI